MCRAENLYFQQCVIDQILHSMVLTNLVTRQISSCLDVFVVLLSIEVHHLFLKSSLSGLLLTFRQEFFRVQLNVTHLGSSAVFFFTISNMAVSCRVLLVTKGVQTSIVINTAYSSNTVAKFSGILLNCQQCSDE